MRSQRKIAREATRGKSVISAEGSRAGLFQGRRSWGEDRVFTQGANSYSTWHLSTARHRLQRKACFWMHIRQALDTIASRRCGSSTMQKKCSRHFRTYARGSQDRKSNRRCSWWGTQQTGFAPNGLSPFSPRSSSPWSGMTHTMRNELSRDLRGGLLPLPTPKFSVKRWILFHKPSASDLLVAFL